MLMQNAAVQLWDAQRGSLFYRCLLLRNIYAVTGSLLAMESTAAESVAAISSAATALVDAGTDPSRHHFNKDCPISD